MAKKKFVGTVILRDAGKVYGATSREVNAINRADAVRVLKEKFRFGNNSVTVSKLKLVKNIKKMGFY